MFPGGNTTIARLMLKALIPAAIDGPDSVEGVSANQVKYSALDVPGAKARIHVSSTAISSSTMATRTRPTLSASCISRGQTIPTQRRLRCDGGRKLRPPSTLLRIFRKRTARHMEVLSLSLHDGQRGGSNWRFLYKLGMTGCRWFEGIGNYLEVRKLALNGIEKPTISPDSPIVLNLKVLYSYPGLSTEDREIGVARRC